MPSVCSVFTPDRRILTLEQIRFVVRVNRRPAKSRIAMRTDLLALVFARRAEAVTEDMFADALSLAGAGFLIEAKVNTACDSRFIDIVCDLFEGCVVQNDLGSSRVAQRDPVALRAEHFLKHRSRGTAKAGVPGRISRKGRREDQWCPLTVRIRFGVTVSVGGADGGDGAPQVEMIFRLEARDCSIPYRDRKQGEDSSVLRQGLALSCAYLTRRGIVNLIGVREGIEPRQVRLLVRSGRAIGITEALHFIVRERIPPRVQGGRRISSKLSNVRYYEGGDLTKARPESLFESRRSRLPYPGPDLRSVRHSDIETVIGAKRENGLCNRGSDAQAIGLRAAVRNRRE